MEIAYGVCKMSLLFPTPLKTVKHGMQNSLSTEALKTDMVEDLENIN